MTSQEASTSPTPPGDECGEGKYCDGKTSKDCPIGSYNVKTTAGSLADCLSCTPGRCCPSVATGPADEMCPEGHYCPAGTGACDSLPCPGQLRSFIILFSSSKQLTFKTARFIAAVEIVEFSHERRNLLYPGEIVLRTNAFYLKTLPQLLPPSADATVAVISKIITN